MGRASGKRKTNITNVVTPEEETPINAILKTKHRVKCKNAKQKEFLNLITQKEIVIAAGPAGVGKSYIAIARALELLQNTSTPYTKMVISKPAVEAGEKHGFLPGDINEKMAVHVQSSISIVDKIIGKANRLKLMEAEIIQIEALAFIRGATIDNSILVMEEVQNMSPNQVKTLLTRIGENAKFILSGDLDQSDVFKNVNQSGLYDAMKRHKNVDEIGFFTFDVEDIVRNPIITKILKNYERVDNVVVVKDDKKERQLIAENVIRANNLEHKKKRKNSFFRKIKIFFKRNFKL